jgi:hypothetical protein
MFNSRGSVRNTVEGVSVRLKGVIRQERVEVKRVSTMVGSGTSARRICVTEPSLKKNYAFSI